ncbi:sodium:solute symporter [Chloroflexota bacterium]
MLTIIIVIVYFLGVLAIGLMSRRQAKGLDDFFVAGRKGSSLFITGSLLATIVGGSATIGMAGLGFTRGLTGAWWLLVGSIGLIVLGLFFAEKVRKFRLYTLPQIVEKQYGRVVAMVASLLIVIAWTAILAGQIIAFRNIMIVLGWGNPTIWMVAFSLVFIAYTILGGQHAVIRTDALQTVIIFAGIFTTLALVLSRLGGIDGLKASLPPEQFAFPLSPQFGPVALVSYLLLIGLTYVVGPDMYSRLFSARDEKTARVAVLSTAGIIIPLALAITVIGMGAAALFPQIPVPDQALPTVINEVLPPILSGIVMAALLCAIMSSADTILLSASTILTVDIIKKVKPALSPRKTLAASRWTIVALGLTSLALSLVLEGVIRALLFAYTIYSAGVILPVIAGFYQRRLRVTPRGALAAIIGGGGAALSSRLLSIKYLDLGSLLISALLLFVVSFIDYKLTNKRTRPGPPGLTKD